MRRQETPAVALMVDASSVHPASDLLLGARRQTLGEQRVLLDEGVDGSLSRTQSDILRASRSRLVTTTTSTRPCTHHESRRRSAGPRGCRRSRRDRRSARRGRPSPRTAWPARSPRSARAARRTRSGPARRARPTGGCRWRSEGRGGRRRRSSWAPLRGVPASMAVSGCSTFDSWRLLARLLVGSPVTELGRR
jgi:hypothetical protein